MRRWAREPLLHFALLGAAIFALEGALTEPASGAAGGEAIVVSQGRVENLAALFAKTWQRPATPDELRDLVDHYVLEEALYREGVTLGLDRDDTIIRRRVRQKMEFVVDDVVELVEPTEDDLESWLAENRESYALPSRFSFRQVYLSPDRRGDALRADADRLLSELRSPTGVPDPAERGDGFLLGHAFQHDDPVTIARAFGPAFAEGLAALPTAEWSGPVESSFGLHLVIVDARTEGRPATLAEVRAAVLRDWREAQRGAVTKRYREELLSRYRVSIDWPDGLPGGDGHESGRQPDE